MKKIKIVSIIAVIIITITTQVYASDSIFSTAKQWLQDGKANADIGIDTSTLQTGSSKLYNILLAVASATAIIVGAILGVQLMTAGIDEKVKVKEALIPYAISCVVIFGALGIWKLVVSIVGEIIII